MKHVGNFFGMFGMVVVLGTLASSGILVGIDVMTNHGVDAKWLVGGCALIFSGVGVVAAFFFMVDQHSGEK